MQRMRRSLLLLAGFIVAVFCQAAVAETDPIIGSRPDPGLQEGGTPALDKGKIPAKKPARVNTLVDALDEEIISLPVGDLRLTAGDTEGKIERLVYDIYVKGLPAGKAEFELKRQEKYGKANPMPVFMASLSTRSNRATSLFYDVKDRVSSIFDAKGGFSRLFSMDRKEGNSKVAERITFNYEKDGASALYERPRPDADKDAKWVASTIPMTGKALDPLSAIYFMRSSGINLKNIQLGKSKAAITLPICSDRHVWNTRLYAVGVDHPDIGTFKNRDCVVFEIDAPFKGLFERVGKIRAWFDIETGVAVKMTAEISIGPAEAVLNIEESKNSPLNK